MKCIIILSLIVLIMLLALPGAVSAADLSVSGSIVDDDLTVTAISPNAAFASSGNFMFANESNAISVTVKNNGGLDAPASTVSVNIGGTTYTAAVGALAANASETIVMTDTVTTRAAGTVTVTATADSAGVVGESNETNNAMTSVLTVYNNGYKGKRWTGGNDMSTQVSYDGKYDVVYSAGDSAYKSSKWSSVTDTWTAANLTIPAGATVVSARLYQPYNFNKMASDPAFTASFNGNTVSPVATYKDIKGFGSSNYPYGVYVYDVTSRFNTAGNTLVLTPEGTPGTTNDYALYGAYLIVVFSDPAATEKQIRINEEYDMITSAMNAPSYKYPVTDAEATVYVPFSGIDNSNVGSARAIAILASASDSGRSKFFFNSQEYTGFWADYLNTPNIGFSVYNVASALQNGANEARLQSYDTGAGGDGMYAMNTILVVEKTGAPTIDVSVTPASIGFGTMKAGVDSTNSTLIAVNTTGGTAWSVAAAANNGGYMKAGTTALASAFQLANGSGGFHAMTSGYANFMTGTAGEDRTDTANVKQAIAAADPPGVYSITLTFTGGFV